MKREINCRRESLPSLFLGEQIRAASRTPDVSTALIAFHRFPFSSRATVAMQCFRTHICALSALAIAFSLFTVCHADFAFDFSVPQQMDSQFFFLLSNTTSAPTFATPFPVGGGFLNLTREKFQTAHAMWYRNMQFVDDGFNFTFQFRIPDRTNRSGDGLAFVVRAPTISFTTDFLQLSDTSATCTTRFDGPL